MSACSKFLSQIRVEMYTELKLKEVELTRAEIEPSSDQHLCFCLHDRQLYRLNQDSGEIKFCRAETRTFETQGGSRFREIQEDRTTGWIVKGA